MSSGDFDRFISGRKAIVDFYSDWCYPCKRLEEYMERKFKEHDITVGRVNCDTDPDICNRYGVEYIPMLVLFVEKKPVYIVIGYDKKAVDIMIRLYQELSDEEAFQTLKNILSFAEKHDLLVNAPVLIPAIHFRGKRCPCRPNITQCPCPDALEWINKKGRCYCGLFIKPKKKPKKKKPSQPM